MLITIRRQVFESLDAATLVEECFEPVHERLRGVDMGVRQQTYEQLTSGQWALLLYELLYEHTQRGIVEFYRRVPYLPVKTDIWAAIKSAMGYFGDEAMPPLLAEMEATYQGYTTIGRDEHSDEAAKVRRSIEYIDSIFPKIVPATLKQIAVYIRSHPGEFVQFEA
ncbi:MAG: hypothetical protein ABI947_25980 [Chloroflexota bacterium]